MFISHDTEAVHNVWRISRKAVGPVRDFTKFHAPLNMIEFVSGEEEG